MSAARAATFLRSGQGSWLLYGLIAVAGLVLAGGLVLLFLYLRSRRRTLPPLAEGQGLTPQRLVHIWESFLKSLPSALRGALPDYTHFVVFGGSGSGKSALVSRQVDWRGQTNQLLPSYTADPLLQVYLGNQIIVLELSSALIESTAETTNAALRRLWRALVTTRPPIVVLALSAANLSSAAADRLRQQAQLMRGKINQLAEGFDAAIRTRICLTFMDRVAGYSSLARFLCSQRVSLTLDLGREGGQDGGPAFDAYEKQLPRALVTRAVAEFESIVAFFHQAEELLLPVRGFVSALLESSVIAIRPELQRLYFFSPPPPEHVGSPFEAGAEAQAPVRPRRWIWRWLALGGLLRLRPVETVLGAVLLITALGGSVYIARRHGALVQEAQAAVDAFGGAVQRARSSVTPIYESEAVRRSERVAGQRVDSLFAAEARFLPLRLLYRRDKQSLRRQLVDTIRQGYLVPILQAGQRQRARDRILYTLVVLYATRDNTLGAVVRTQPEDFAATVGMPQDAALSYVEHSVAPWPEVAVLLLPLLGSTATPEQLDAIRGAGRWVRFVSEVDQAIRLPFITLPALQALQRDAGFLQGVLALWRRDALLRKIYQLLSEESPLDMVRLFGAGAGTLSPSPWLTDHVGPLDGLTRLVHDSALGSAASGKISLYKLLKWMNEIGAKRTVPIDELYRISFEDKSYEISKQAWLDLLFRSRKRILLLPASGARKASTATLRCPAPPRPRARKVRLRSGDACPDPCACRAPSAPSAATPSDAPDDPLPPRSQAAPHSRRGGAAAGLRSGHGRGVPVFHRDELAPKLAALLTGDELPAAGLSDLYNRAVFNKEVLPLVLELKKSLATNAQLSPEEKIGLARLVQDELRGYARRYCESLLNYLVDFHISTSEGIHSALLNLIKPGSPFVEHLRVIADNVNLEGLNEPYLKPMAECVAAFRPLSLLLTSKDGAYPGLDPYNAAIQALLLELDAPRGDSSKPGGDAEPRLQTLADVLTPLGRSALRMSRGEEGTPLRKAEQFLDKAGVSGLLRRPFLAPFAAAYRQGTSEIELAMNQHFRDVLLGQLGALLGRFPFDRRAPREVDPEELEILNPQRGPFFSSVKAFYAPFLVEREGSFEFRMPAGASVALGGISPPRELLGTLNQLSRMARLLYRADGTRQPLRLVVRGVPLPIETGPSVPSLSIFSVGRSAAYSFNQQAVGRSFDLEWWAEGVASVGIELTMPTSNRRQTQSVEVSDSPWSFYRLLQKATPGAGGAYTWQLPVSDESPGGDGVQARARSVSFVFERDPWEPFTVPKSK